MRAWDVLTVDLEHSLGVQAPTGTVGRLKLFCRGLSTVKGIAVIGFRVSHGAGRRSPPLGRLIKQITQVITGADIGHGTVIGPGLRIVHPSGIVISEEARLGSYCSIQSCSTISRATVIGDDVAIGPGARILPDVRIDDGCHVAANAVVTRSIPGEWMVLGGIPAEALHPRKKAHSSGRQQTDPV